MTFFHRCLFIAVSLAVLGTPCLGEEEETQYDPTRYGVMLSVSNTSTMDEDIDLLRASLFVSFDYDKIWRHWAPENLRWKLEFTTGMTTSPFSRNVTSLVMIAQYYFPDEGWTKYKIRPFVEGGVGLAYADFQIEGQGSRWMGNPQLGVGSDFVVFDQDLFLTLRFYDHFSNAGVDDENRGLNFITASLGYYF